MSRRTEIKEPINLQTTKKMTGDVDDDRRPTDDRRQRRKRSAASSVKWWVLDVGRKSCELYSDLRMSESAWHCLGIFFFPSFLLEKAVGDFCFFLLLEESLIVILQWKIHICSEELPENVQETRSLALTPTWSVATVLTIFVAVSLLVERSIHRLSNWLRKTNRKPLLAALEKMKEELMLLGFISLLLTATSSMIANICIPLKFYNSAFSPCSRSEIDEEMEENDSKERKLLMASAYPRLLRRMLNGINRNSCREGYEPFVSYEGLEQLHRFIFVMAVTHISYSCLTMLLAIVKIHSWRVWEDEAHMDRHDSLS
ncbi:MLO-like protein 11, partial [Gastrolobium bilobum]|uniref:MLO-like protein 11 n=1 Tax=Gastrolobium bilobum TaxID=150636 RepID=UPI002AB20BCA